MQEEPGRLHEEADEVVELERLDARSLLRKGRVDEGTYVAPLPRRLTGRGDDEYADEDEEDFEPEPEAAAAEA